MANGARMETAANSLILSIFPNEEKGLIDDPAGIAVNLIDYPVKNNFGVNSKIFLYTSLTSYQH